MYLALLLCSHVCQTRTFLIARTAAGKHAAKTQLLLNLSVHPTKQSPDSVDRMMLSSDRKELRNPVPVLGFSRSGETLATTV